MHIIQLHTVLQHLYGWRPSENAENLQVRKPKKTEHRFLLLFQQKNVFYSNSVF